MKSDIYIEIVSSSQPGLSSMSKRSRNTARVVLARHYSRVGVSIVNNLTDLESLVARKPDLVFLGMKFIPTNPVLGWQDSQKIWISDYLENRGIAHTGSNKTAHMLELNKASAKQRIHAVGLNTSPFYFVDQSQALVPSDINLRYPLFVKPADRGGGLGIDSDSVVYSFEQLQAKVQLISKKFHSDSLIEEYLPGREFSVAILKHEYSSEFSVMPLERVAPADEHGVRILSPQVKHADAGFSLEVTDEVIKAKVTTLAIKAFHALGARDFGRIDIRLDSYGTPQFLEANLIPSLIDGYGNFPKACLLNLGLGYEPMILSITRLGLARNEEFIQNVLEYASQSTSVVSLFEPALGI